MTRRLVLSYLLLALAILAALEVPLALNYASRLEAELTADLQRDAFAIASYAEDTVEGRGNTDLGLLARSYGERTGARIVIVDKDGRTLADSSPSRADENFSNRDEIATALAGRVASGVRPSTTLGTDLLYVAVPIASGGVFGAVRISYSMDQLQDRIHAYWWTLAGIAAVSLLAATAIGIAVARGVVRPLAEVQAAAHQLGAGDLAARAPDAAGPPEVRDLARTFNRMADRLAGLLESQEQFVADASHQLRTPLTALRLRLENLAEELPAPTEADRPGATDADAAAAARRDLEAALAETTRLSRLIDGLLALARADRADLAVTAETLAVDDVLADRREMWAPVAAERDVELATEPSPLSVRATPDRLSQVLDNLLANALDAAPPGTTITLRAARDGVAGGDEGLAMVELHVTDEGPGLDADQRRRAFDRFWRASSTRPAAGDDALGGSGLGLAIVRKLAVADGGDAELRAASGGGLDAVVRLPAGSGGADVGPGGR